MNETLDVEITDEGTGEKGLLRFETRDNVPYATGNLGLAKFEGPVTDALRLLKGLQSGLQYVVNLPPGTTDGSVRPSVPDDVPGSPD